jgi:hypothetical protein
MSDARAVPGCSDPGKGAVLESYLEHRLAPEEEAEFEDHYFRCAACLEELRLRQTLPAALRGVDSARRHRQIWLSFAGAAAAALLVYTSYLGFVELPAVTVHAGELKNEVSDLKTSLLELNSYRDARRWTGPVSLVVLTGPARAAGAEAATVRLVAGQPFVPLAVVPSLPPAVKPGDQFTFQIRDAGGEIAWSSSMTGQEIARVLAADRLVTFLIPAEGLMQGEHKFTLVHAADQSAKPAWETAFRVETAK